MLMVGASALLASAADSRGEIKIVAEHNDSNTFYSEIDVIDRDAPETEIAEAPAMEVRRETVEAEGGMYQVTIDTSETPDLTEWAHQELAPVVREWYPKLVNEELWKERTGHSVQELGDEWKKSLEEKLAAQADPSSGFTVSENESQIIIVSDKLEAAIQKRGYVTGVAGGSLLDKQTGFRDAGFGLDIVDWIMEPGSDEAYRDQLPGDLAYQFNNAYHGRTPKRSMEGPQICTQAKVLSPVVIRGKDSVAVKTQYQYHLAAPGKKTGSVWNQTIVFPAGKRYFISSDQITTVNAGEALFLRIDMPGHIKHNQGDAFSEVYLSYFGKIPAGEFLKDFAPDEKFNYRRDRDKIPRRFIRAYHLRDLKTGREGPWLAGMTLEPSVVYEAWCHQRGYVCLIEEFGGRRVRPGESFSAAFIVGYFDSVEEMESVYDQFAGHTRLQVDEQGWKLVKSVEPAP